ncbi:MAG: YczE/YyaS/YitT family protein [Tumebacillaceae bacterium]
MQIQTNTKRAQATSVHSQLEPYWPWFLRRFLIMTVGLFVLAVGIVLIVRAKMGASPWDVLHVGLTYHVPISFGVAQEVVGLLLLTITCLFAKRWPTWGTFYNIIMVGQFCDWIYNLVPSPDLWIWKGVQFAIGLLLCGYGVGIYISSNLGAGPRDWLMLLLHEKTGLQIRWVRTMLEVCVVVIGIMLGGPFSFGTILFSLLVGHPTDWGIKWARRVFRSFVERRERRNEIVN